MSMECFIYSYFVFVFHILRSTGAIYHHEITITLNHTKITDCDFHSRIPAIDIVDNFFCLKWPGFSQVNYGHPNSCYKKMLKEHASNTHFKKARRPHFHIN